MIEKIAFMQVEDNMVSFEKKNGDTIIYPIVLVPVSYKPGDIISAIIHDGDFIEFIDLDTEEMQLRSAKMKEKKSRIRDRARRTNRT